MSEPVLNSNISKPVARYDERMNAILFCPQGTEFKTEPISIYITLLRDPETQSLVGISFTEFHMMTLTLEHTGSIQTGSPLLLEDVFCIAKRLSGSGTCDEALLREIKCFLGTAVLPIEDVLEIPQYARA